MKLRLFPKKVRILFSLFLFFSFCIATAQAQKTVTGTVLSSEDNTPLPGASVVEKGTNNGTSTDFDGKFSLNVASDATIIVVSYIGYVNQEVTITGSELTITLQADANALDEVIVVGYGTLKKSDVVSSVAKIEIDAATAIPTTNISEMLRGKAAGVQVAIGDGSLRPGGTSEIVIRGKNSIAGNNAPIFVLDGVTVDNINDINSDDIVSIEILKDASAQAIYGARASNGVILVTTKRGKSGKIQVSYHAYTTTQSISKNFDLYTGQEYAQLRREAFRTNNPNDEFEDDDFVFELEELDALQNNSFVDWEGEVLENATIFNQSLSVSAGGESTKVFASLGYYQQDGLIPTSAFERGTFRLNVDQKISNKLSMEANIALSTSLQDKESSSLNFITLSPLGRVRDDNGDLVRYPNGSPSYTNPLWNIRESNNVLKSNSYNFNFVTKYNITEKLAYRLNTSLTRKANDEGQYFSSLHSSGRDSNGFAKIKNSFLQSYLIENILTYVNQINDDHKIDVTLVQSIDERKASYNNIEGKEFANDVLGFDGIGSALSVIFPNFNPDNPERSGRYVEKRNLASFLGRVRYNLQDKYLFTLTARADGSSVFGKDNKWAYFPAAAFAWKIQNEDFLKDSEAVNELKLRLSYGSIGNEAVRPYQTFGTATPFLYTFDGAPQSGFLPSKILPNPNLKWETTTSFNVGIDFGLFNNLLEGSIEYYKTNTTDLLIRRTTPGGTGYDLTFFNAGEVENKGLELLLTANIINNENLKWSVTTTFANNKNEILDLFGVDQNGDPLDDELRGLYVGQPIGVIRAQQIDGVWQEGEDFANSPQAGEVGIGPGSLRVIDTDGSGVIDSDDRVFINPNPDWFGSITSSLKYKGFDLFADLYIVEGATKSNPYLAGFNQGGSLQGVLNGIRVPYWTPENPSTTFPRPNKERADPYLFDNAVQDASYVRLRTLSLGYTIPEFSVANLNVNSVKIYATATNLFTITDYKSYSPEVNPGAYPDAKAFTLGLKVNF